jgi:CxxC motif-containing protein (DUF1111 family)
MVTACLGSSGDLMQPDSGGETTTESSNRDAFGNAARNLTSDERRTFEVGDSFFTQNWVTAPASTDARDGLGPLFNAQACASCHVRDGRGNPEQGEIGLLFRLGVISGEEQAPHPTYGGQFQDRAVLGVVAEGTVRRLYVEEVGEYADGVPYSLRRPMYEFEDLAYGEITMDVLVSPRLAPPVFGSGLLEAIPESDLLEAADPDDSDGDGISGRANMVIDTVSGEMTMGRFGWKANVASVEEQVSSAFSRDIGITSVLFPNEDCTEEQVECANAPSGGDPEIPTDRLEKVVFYSRTLAVPARRDLDSPDVAAGADLFVELGCASCHQPRQETGDSDIAALANQEIFPFTDLLIHDMGPDLADGRPDGEASGSEWRTPPLWGLGLTETVSGSTFFLHDGRARSVEEAILWHGGEAEQSANDFRSLSAVQRSQLLAFLESL